MRSVLGLRWLSACELMEANVDQLPRFANRWRKRLPGVLHTRQPLTPIGVCALQPWSQASSMLSSQSKSAKSASPTLFRPAPACCMTLAYPR